MLPDIAPESAYTMMHIAAAVVQRTPLPTVLLRDVASTAARLHVGLSVLSAMFFTSEATSFRILGKSIASAATVESMQTVARMIFVLKKNVTTARARKMIPMTRVVLLYLYSVSLLSKMMSLMDVLRALRIAFKGIRHSIRTAPKITPITSAKGYGGISSLITLPEPSSARNRKSRIGFLITEYNAVAGMLPKRA